MCEPVDFFEQALAEQGLDANVTHESGGLTNIFHVSKKIAGETVTYSTTVSNTIQSDKKQMAMAANNIVEVFEDRLTEIFEWDGRRIKVVPYDEPEAICETCGASVELPYRNRMFANSAELSAPQPMPVENKTVLESLDDHSRVLLKMYLIGKLREECKSHCPNSKYSTEKFI